MSPEAVIQRLVLGLIELRKLAPTDLLNRFLRGGLFLLPLIGGVLLGDGADARHLAGFDRIAQQRAFAAAAGELDLHDAGKPDEGEPCHGVGLDRRVGLDAHAGDHLAGVVGVEPQFTHFTDTDAVVLHGAAAGQAGDGFGEHDLVFVPTAVGDGSRRPQREQQGKHGNRQGECPDQYVVSSGFHRQASRRAARPRGPWKYACTQG